MLTAYFSARNRRAIDPVCTSMISIAPLAPPVTSCLPSAVNAMAKVASSWSRTEAFR